MLWKAIKLSAITAAAAGVVGFVVFGTDFVSYAHSSWHAVASSVKQNIPLDFQIRRARDLLEQTGPEMRKNVRLIAEEEVDIASLRTALADAQQSVDGQKVRLAAYRDNLTTNQAAFVIGEFTYTRPQLTRQLAEQLQSYTEAQTALDQKQQLLQNRQTALAAAEQAMQRAGAQRAELQSEIDTLEARYRLVQATSAGTDMQMDNSKLSQAEQVVAGVQHELAVSERMLAREAKFAPVPASPEINEKDLLTKVDAQLSAPHDGLSDATGATVSNGK